MAAEIELTWLMTRVAEALLLPPTSLLVLAVIGLASLKRHQRLGKALIVISILGILALSLPMAAYGLRTLLESEYPAARETAGDARAIVVLGGGVRRLAPEFGGDAVNHATLERLRYAARIYRATMLPILATGGRPEGGRPEAELMAEALRTDFGVPVRWTEQASINTLENALRSRDLLAPQGIERVVLVTHAMHMPRAVLAFRATGFKVTPAPMGFASAPASAVLAWVPRADALRDSSSAIREFMGIAWYRLQLAFASMSNPAGTAKP